MNPNKIWNRRIEGKSMKAIWEWLCWGSLRSPQPMFTALRVSVSRNIGFLISPLRSRTVAASTIVVFMAAGAPALTWATVLEDGKGLYEGCKLVAARASKIPIDASAKDIQQAYGCLTYLRGYADAQAVTVTFIRRSYQILQTIQNRKSASKNGDTKTKAAPESNAAKVKGGVQKQILLEEVTDPELLAEFHAHEYFEKALNGESCIPKETDNLTLVRAVTRFVEDAPPNDVIFGMPPDFLVSFAFLKAFPCR